MKKLNFKSSSVTGECYVVVALDQDGREVYWRPWTGASIDGRPKWVDILTIKCFFANRRSAENVIEGGSRHWDPTGKTNIEVREIRWSLR